MKLSICLPLIESKEYTQFWDSFTLMQKPDYNYHRPQYKKANIDIIRNELVKQALKIDATHILLMDTDQCYPPNTLVRLLTVMEQTGADAVGTVVYRRYEPYDPLVWNMGGEGLVKVEDKEVMSGKVIEADVIGCGCVLYKARVFAEMRMPWFEDLSHVIKPDGKQGPGEDINFCYKLKNANRRLVVDTSIDIIHIAEIGIEKNFYLLYKKLQSLKEK